MFLRLTNFVKKRRLLSFFIVVLLVVAGYFGYQKFTKGSAQTLYVLAQVEKGSVISSVSGSGQISASNQVEVKPKASGDVVKLNVVVGSNVKAGDVLAVLNSQEGQKAVRDAQVSLNSAKLSLEKLKRGSRPEELTATNLQLETAQKNLITVQEKNKVSLDNVYSDTQDILQNTADKVDDILNRQIDSLFVNGSSDAPKLVFLSSDSSAVSNAEWQRVVSRRALSQLQKIASDVNPSQDTLDSYLIDAKAQVNLVQDFLSQLSIAARSGIPSGAITQTSINSYQSTVSSARTSTDSLATSLNSQMQINKNQKISNQDNLTSAQDNLVSAQNSLALKQLAADPLDLKAQEIAVAQRANALADAREQLADYTIKSPIDGVVASTTIKVGDSLSSGTAAVTIITKQVLAEISLNEVDAAKIKAGQKATLTFDAIDGLSLSGLVASIDSLGTVSQGVVTYNAKIALDTQDDRIKPGMSVSASIIIDFKTDVLTVPNAAIKTQDTSSYVLVPSETISTSSDYASGIALANSPNNQTVQVGLANDTTTEIVTGLKEGDFVVIRTTTSTSATSASSASSNSKSILQTGGGPGGMR